MQGREHDLVIASIWLGGLHASRAMKAKKRKPVILRGAFFLPAA